MVLCNINDCMNPVHTIICLQKQTRLPDTLAGRGIQGVLHGMLHRYVTTQMVYCLCGCLCGTIILKIREDFDVANFLSHFSTSSIPWWTSRFKGGTSTDCRTTLDCKKTSDITHTTWQNSGTFKGFISDFLYPLLFAAICTPTSPKPRVLPTVYTQPCTSGI